MFNSNIKIINKVKGYGTGTQRTRLNCIPAPEGLITYVDGETLMSGFDDINLWVGNAATNDSTKSFLDADLIKRYNGGKYLSFDIAQKKWAIQNMNNYDPPFDYVKRVSEIAD